MAVLLNAFGLSLMKTSGFFSILSEPVSKSSVKSGLKRLRESSALTRSHANIRLSQ